MTPIDLLVLALATWYVAFVVTNPNINGPFGLLAAFRGRFSLGGLTHCKVCFAPWAAGALYLLSLTPLQPFVVVLAIAGAALMLGAYSGAGHQG